MKMMQFNYPPGATPLDSNEIEDLLLTHITNQRELNRWEQENISEAIVWYEEHKPKNILNESFIKQVHKRMFDRVWKWAGKFRQSQKNIGDPWHSIPTNLKNLCDTIRFRIKEKTYPEDEIAVRFHHMLVSIHPFINGNGRHARLMADLMLQNVFSKSPFTWGSKELTSSSDNRNRYLQALYTADKFDYQPLLEFAKS